MPRIAADSVAEHVERQERAVYDAAIRLFIAHGYPAVTLGDIAAEVGLARSSLYRYFPDKASILVRWYRGAMPALVGRSAALLAGDDPPARRIGRWADAEIDYAREPQHRLIAALGAANADLDAEVVAEIADGHRRIMAPFHRALAAAGLAGDELDATAELLWSTVMAQAGRELQAGDDPAGRRVLRRAIDALVGGRTEPGRRP